MTNFLKAVSEDGTTQKHEMSGIDGLMRHDVARKVGMMKNGKEWLDQLNRKGIEKERWNDGLYGLFVCSSGFFSIF